VVAPTGRFPAGEVCYWLQLGWVDIEEAESVGVASRVKL
jgi:hypothetical protein